MGIKHILLRSFGFNTPPLGAFPHFSGYPVRLRRAGSLIVSIICLLFTVSVQAGLKPDPPSGLTARNYLIMDALTNRVLAEKAADEQVAPASLTKIMTGYLVFKALQSGELSLDEKVLVSEKAWRTGMTGASRMYIEVNTKVMVEDLIRGIIVQSGNDACVALAERIAGTEASFVAMMNAQARDLGLINTKFQNSHGLPAKLPQLTSARDIVILTGDLIRKFPEYYKYYSERSFTYNNIIQYNRNLLLARDDSVDGVKTGWTSAAGYNLVSSAQRNGMRLVAVVMGIKADSAVKGSRARADQSRVLLNWGFRQFETVMVQEPNKIIAEPRIWKGSESILPVGTNEIFYVTIPRASRNSLRLETNLPEEIEAPVQAGQTIGTLKAFVGNDSEPVGTQFLVALKDIPEGNIFRRFLDSVLRNFH
jgi:serine-type D-Ala-D-Ala carboxypeptidase (penicillin-binding protein 5/6)